MEKIKWKRGEKRDLRETGWERERRRERKADERFIKRKVKMM